MVAIVVHAQTNNFPAWKAVVTVVGDVGQPVGSAQVKVAFGEQLVADGTVRKAVGKTDLSGMFIASGTGSSYGYGITAEKDGYYRNGVMVEFGHPSTFDDLHPNVTLILKKIEKPIPMYAKHTFNMTVPDTDKPIGYDLEVGDWVGPYGKGVTADILFTTHLINPPSSSEYTITISFPNQNDGIQVYVPTDAEMGSALHSPHEAPPDGYQPRLTRENSNRKSEHDEHRIYLFRVRTKTDDRGNIVSAHYGKIYGDFMQFTYYLNPTPNDRNIEFDPSQNLIHNLNEFEGVSEP
jgi:hypothetical protein